MRRISHRYGNGDRMQAEDYAQNARLYLLTRGTDRDIPQLYSFVKSSITRTRTFGSSVDGKIDQSPRQFRYSLIHLDEPTPNGKHDFHEVCSPYRDRTAAQALCNAFCDEFAAMLDMDAREAFAMRLQGFSWDEIGEELYGETRNYFTGEGVTKQQAVEMRLQEAAREYWGIKEEEKREIDEQDIVRRYEAGIYMWQIAKHYRTSQSNVRDIIEHHKNGTQKNRRLTNRTENFFELLAGRESVTREEMLEFFSGCKNPMAAIPTFVNDFNRRSANLRIVKDGDTYTVEAM